MSSRDTKASTAAPPRPPRLDQKNSPSRSPFRPPLSLTFPLRVLPSNSASTYSGSVLGARGNLGAPPQPDQGLRSTSRPQFAEIQLSTFPQQGVQLVDNPERPRGGRVRACRTSALRRSRAASIAFIWALVFGLYVWLGGLAVGVNGGTAFIFGAVTGFLVFLLVMAFGAGRADASAAARRPALRAGEREHEHAARARPRSSRAAARRRACAAAAASAQCASSRSRRFGWRLSRAALMPPLVSAPVQPAASLPGGTNEAGWTMRLLGAGGLALARGPRPRGRPRPRAPRARSAGRPPRAAEPRHRRAPRLRAGAGRTGRRQPGRTCRT